MITKEKIKSIKQLHHKKYREAHNLFIVEGAINTLDYLKSDLKLHELYATHDFMESNSESLSEFSTTVISSKDMSRISALKNHSPLLGIFSIPNPDTTKEIILHNNKTYLALDDIHDPGNLGTIIRTADWFGISEIFCSINSVDAYNPKVVQASMGSLSRVKVRYVSLVDLLLNQQNRIPIYGAVLDGMPLNELKNPEPGIIIIGSEAHGISGNLIKLINYKVTIPLAIRESGSEPESLNASIAAAILCYEITKS